MHSGVTNNTISTILGLGDTAIKEKKVNLFENIYSKIFLEIII